MIFCHNFHMCFFIKYKNKLFKKILGELLSFSIFNPDLTDKMEHSFFQAVVESLLLYGCTT